MHSAAVTGVPSLRTGSSRSRQRVALIVAAVAAWSAIAWTVAWMLRNVPPTAGFDLELLMLGGRRVAAGLSPYDPGLVNGQSVHIASLFYSYPPVVAQAFSMIGNLPLGIVLLVWTVLAGLLVVALGALFMRRLPSGGTVGDVAWWLPVATPFWFPFTVAVMFGNLDAFFPFLYGVLLLAAMLAAGLASGGRGTLIGAGVALGLVSVTKLHPASIALWFALRGWTEWRAQRGAAPASWIVLGVGAFVGIAAVGASLMLGGPGPWQHYVAVLRAGTNFDLLDARNLAPSVQVALSFGLGQDAVRAGQIAVTAFAVASTTYAALRMRDPAVSLLVASVGSLVILPVTWFHYFGILIPFAVAALLRSAPGNLRQVAGLLSAAFGAGVLGLRLPVAWAMPVLVLAALVISARSPIQTTRSSA